LLAQAVFKTQSVRALVWAVKGGHVLIYIVVLSSQELGKPIGKVLWLFLRAVLAGISGRTLWFGGILTPDRPNERI
jgi:hypothetical protein